MARISAFVLGAVVLCFVCSVSADYSVWEQGVWPETWPDELELLRQQATTYEGPLRLDHHYMIPFAKREAFESAWPHLLKVKSEGAPIILVRGPKTDFFKVEPAGVLIHRPEQTQGSARPEKPIAGHRQVRAKWMNTTFIELVVDGEIVDLNRIALSPDTPIVDERFKDSQAVSNRR